MAFRYAIKRVQEEKNFEKRIVGGINHFFYYKKKFLKFIFVITDVRKLRFGDIYGAYESTCTAIKVI